MGPSFEADGTKVTWVGGGLLVERGGLGSLIDVPPGTVDRLGPALARVQAVTLTSGRIRAVGGLVPLLVELARWRVGDVPLSLRFPLGEERGAMLAETWVRGWPDLYPLTLDAELPGSTFEVGGLEVTTAAVSAGEPRWRDGDVASIIAVGLRISAPGLTVAWVPGAAPTRAVERLCAGVDLAIVEVGVTEWPRADRPWRMTAGDAARLAGSAKTLWIVGDDGGFGPGAAE